jgi:hypothetical protein
MPSRILGKDLDMNEHFELAALPNDGGPADALEIRVQCKHCNEQRQAGTLKGQPKTWEVTLEADGSLDRGVRAALLQHAHAHFNKPKMRRVS